MKLRPIGKKADLSLSINAIVILILAITVLSLGLTFIKGMFSKADIEVGKAFDINKFERKPNIDTPLVFQRDSMDIVANKETEIPIGIFNPSTQKTFVDAKPKFAECIKASDESVVTPEFKLASTKQDVPPRTAVGFSTILTYSGKDTGTFICSVEAEGTGLDIEVQSAIKSQVYLTIR